MPILKDLPGFRALFAFNRRHKHFSNSLKLNKVKFLLVASLIMWIPPRLERLDRWIMHFFNPKIETMGNDWATFQKRMIWPPFSCFFLLRETWAAFPAAILCFRNRPFAGFVACICLSELFGIRCLTKYEFICILHTACIW